MIRKIDELDFSEFNKTLFTHCYFSNNKPLLIHNMFLNGKGDEYWTLDYLLSLVKSSDQKVGVAVYEKRDSRYEQFYESYQEEEKDVAEALKLVSSNPEDTGKFHNLLEANIPELIEPINIPEFLEDKTAATDGNLWIGNGNISRLHFDMPNNFYFQIKGKKTFHLYEPANYFYLYPLGSNASAIEDAQHIDPEKFPLAKNAQPITVTLEPGSFLYMPPFWWHQVESQEPYISLNYWGNPRLDQVLCHPGYYEFIKHFDLGILVQMYEMCNKTGFEDYSFEDVMQFVLYKGYHWAAYILGLSLLQVKLQKLLEANDILPDPSIAERTAQLLSKMNKQEVSPNGILFETLGEDRLFDVVVKIRENQILPDAYSKKLYKFISYVKAAKNNDNIAITPELVNELIAFNQQVSTAAPVAV
jgi:hypothetical protein